MKEDLLEALRIFMLHVGVVSFPLLLGVDHPGLHLRLT
jgi:hypothetical protein